MRYRVSHTTTYAYSDVVPICHNEAYLTPRSGPAQTVHHMDLDIRPRPTVVDTHPDCFDNFRTHFSLHEAHRKLVIRAVSDVTVHGLPPRNPASFPAWNQLFSGRHPLTDEELGAMQFLYDSPAVTRSGELADYARPHFPFGRSVLDGVAELTERIHREFRYDTRATTVKTQVEEVFRIRRGVCQDFAHLQIGCLRSLGIPARYVSGYLRTIPPPGGVRLVGHDASHAWLSVFCGDAGWVDFDPTNNMVPFRDHVTLAWGRDYFDVCPIKGIIIGGGDQRMDVEVDVMPIE